MPRLEDGQEALLRAEGDLRTRAKHEWEGFTDFALRDNVLEVAVGLIIAAAFKTVVESFVGGIVLPPISLLPFIGKNLDEVFAVLRGGGQDHMRDDYNTMKQAVDDGAIVMSYGVFLNKCLNFIGIAISLFVVARVYSSVTQDNVVKRHVKCKYCRKWISEKAKRCVNCTSWQDGRED